MTRLVLYPSKYESKQVNEILLLKGLGIQGDRHCIGGDRQISLLLKKTGDPKRTPKMLGLCLDKFHENILIEGLSPEQLTIGAVLKLGSAAVEISALKPCYEDCELYLTGASCMLKGHGAFARVLQDGIVRVGDSMEVSSNLHNGNTAPGE